MTDILDAPLGLEEQIQQMESRLDGCCLNFNYAATNPNA